MSRFFYSATVSKTQRVLHLKFVNATDRAQPLTIALTGIQGEHTADIFAMHGATYLATNSIEHPALIEPVHSQETVAAGSWRHTVPALTIEAVDVTY